MSVVQDSLDQREIRGYDIGEKLLHFKCRYTVTRTDINLAVWMALNHGNEYRTLLYKYLF